MEEEHPLPKSICEGLFNSQYVSIIDNGVKERYTIQNLPKPPKEHTYKGVGREFEEYINSLRLKGENFSFSGFLGFLKKETFFLNVFSLVYNFKDCLAPILMETYLGWLQEQKIEMDEGYSILGAIFLLFVTRQISALQEVYYKEIIQVHARNAIEVNSEDFFPSFFEFFLVLIFPFFGFFESLFEFLERFDEKVDQVPVPGDQIHQEGGV